MLPMEALSSSTEGAVTTRSARSGLILILNFFLWSSSSSDSSEEKKGDFLVVGSSAVLRKAQLSPSNSPGFSLHLTYIIQYMGIWDRVRSLNCGTTSLLKSYLLIYSIYSP